MPIKLPLDLALALLWVWLVLLLEKDKEPPEQPGKLWFLQQLWCLPYSFCHIWTWTAQIMLCSRGDLICALFCIHISMCYWRYIVCTSIFHSCFALVANTHLLSSWYRSFMCNSWTLRPRYARDLFTYAQDITQLIKFPLVWCEMPPFLPVSSVWQCWPF